MARLAGISVATASNALTGARPVGDATRQRVLAAAGQLGYEPDRVARALVSQRTDTLAVIIPDIANPFFAEFVRGAERAAAAQGLALLIADTDNDPARERQVIATLRARRVDGVIVVPTSSTDRDALIRLAEACPVVLADRTCPGWRGDVVLGDDSAGMQAVVDHLIGLGHRRIGYVTGDLATSTARDRFAAFRSRLATHDRRPAAIVRSAFTVDSVRPLLDPLFAGRHPTTAICAADDLLALAVLDAARARGRRVPEEVSITGYDDIAYARLAWPPLTTVRLPAGEIGARAVELLLLPAADRPPRRVRVATTLIVRESTGPLPGRRPAGG